MLQFWAHVIDPDPFDPNLLDFKRTCRIYDVDLERFATVDEKHYSQLVTMREHRYKTLRTRRWRIKPAHPRRNGKKLYFVSNMGWRQGKQTFLHVAVMKLTKRRKPTKKHKLVNHIDGDEWNCTELNLEWATHVMNRRPRRGA